MYFISLITKLLHFLPGEVSHHIGLKSLKILYATGLLKFLISDNKTSSDKTIKDLGNLKNKIGIAAGLDKNGDYIDSLAALGIAFIELGTVTPMAQKGNPKPRLFRNRKDQSLLNRLGFNNKGVDYLVRKLKERKSSIIVGTSIGKNFNTPNQSAYKDYVYCLNKVYKYSDYIAVNISSPNTKNLRDLSNINHFTLLLNRLKLKQTELAKLHGYKPIFIKISPDEELDNLKEICELIIENKLDGIICGNTTIDHDHNKGLGGLSGAPLKEKAISVLRFVKSVVGDKLTIIASGGVMTLSDYNERLLVGADLVQIYTGFIYEGPKLIQDILKHSSD
ncbi:MAG: dihydroorotate dehydrogenase (quinone) [Flavobacteriales bacterium]|nr:dihydroorotate dehydrogenase (quinone) [Flavobacteriales bacterium]